MWSSLTWTHKRFIQQEKSDLVRKYDSNAFLHFYIFAPTTKTLNKKRRKHIRVKTLIYSTLWARCCDVCLSLDDWLVDIFPSVSVEQLEHVQSALSLEERLKLEIFKKQPFVCGFRSCRLPDRTEHVQLVCSFSSGKKTMHLIQNIIDHLLGLFWWVVRSPAFCWSLFLWCVCDDEGKKKKGNSMWTELIAWFKLLDVLLQIPCLNRLCVDATPVSHWCNYSLGVCC